MEETKEKVERLYCPKCGSGGGSLYLNPDDAILPKSSLLDGCIGEFTFLDFECRDCGARVRAVYDLAAMQLITD